MEVIFIVGLYMLPAIIAGIRKHHQGGAILVVNLFLGWTFLGWVIALAMACGNVKEVNEKEVKKTKAYTKKN